MTGKPFTDLDVYQECRNFRKLIKKVTVEHFPKSEEWRLTDQIIRASRSVTANIAEGHGRFYYKENVRFCRNARGSMEEVLEHLITAFDETYIDAEKLTDLKLNYDTCMRLINGYIRYLLKSKNEEF